MQSRVALRRAEAKENVTVHRKKTPVPSASSQDVGSRHGSQRIGLRSAPTLAAAALLIGTAGGFAGSAVGSGLYTSRDIKDHTITSADLRNGRITGKDFKDESLTAVDF